jgi:hypothetical protein
MIRKSDPTNTNDVANAGSIINSLINERSADAGAYSHTMIQEVKGITRNDGKDGYEPDNLSPAAKKFLLPGF